MPTMLKVKVRWSGFSGAPGWSNFYFRDFTADPLGNPTQTQADAAIERVHGFFTTIMAAFPTAFKFDVQSDVDVIEDSNGELVGGFVGPTKNQISGTAAGSTYAGPSGAVINWKTNGFRNGRRVRGRTFFVPVATSAYEGDGSLTATVLTSLRNAATGFSSGTGDPDLGVWSRPSAPGANDGIWYACSGSSVPDMVAILRTRRA